MSKSRRTLSMAVLIGVLSACGDGYLTTTPQTILTDDQVWTNPTLINGVIADIYSRLPEYMNLDVRGAALTGAGSLASVLAMGAYDEAIWGGPRGEQDGFATSIPQYAFTRWALWDYELIRDINLALENIERAQSASLTTTDKAAFLAELRFLRAWTYFEHVKRMGGVPLITSQQVYDFSGDPSYLRHPRASEAAVYEFIAGEMDAILNQFTGVESPRRANRYTALALKSRAMLYAASLARHNNEMAGAVTLPGGEVGIPAAKAAEYYTKSLEASRAIIQSGKYSLYRGNPHPGENFYEALTTKSGNPEVIWAKDYSAAQGRTHLFTLLNIPRSLRIDNFGSLGGSGIAPILQLVEAYDYLDGSPGTLRGVGTGSNTAAGQAGWIFYDSIDDIFDGKDGRLYGTVIYPGTTARGQDVQLQAGVYVWNGTAGKYDRVVGALGSVHSDGGVLTGGGGPVAVESYVSSTGFYIRKYLDSAPAAATGATGSEMWWVRFRLGEIYLNAAEAAFELELQGEALGYVNTVRARAGFPANSLSALTRDRIRNERRVELAFEGHRLWDVKRWRIAHLLWDGNNTNRNARAWVLFPYRVVHPGHPNHGKYVYDALPAPRQTDPRFFRMGNYYSAIPASALGNNPKLVPNPFH